MNDSENILLEKTLVEIQTKIIDALKRRDAERQSLETGSISQANKDTVDLIAVSKGQSIQKIEALYALGQRDFGENYAQELLEKSKQLEHLKDLRWHFLGHLQTNKINSLPTNLTHIHSIHNLNLLKKVEENSFFS